MRWQPKTEDDIAKENLCAEGVTGFTVLEASEARSKSGKDMVKLKLNVHGEDGRDYHVYDYISPHFFEHKFRHFFFSTGRGADYDKGGMDAAAMVGLQGYADIGQEEGNGSYGPKNVIKDYSVPGSGSGKPKVTPEGAVPATGEPTPPEEDDVPF